MKYIRVHWLHGHVDEPVWLISEVDAGDFETRKIEVYRDGVKGYASREQSYGSTRLGETALPQFDEIARDPQFKLEEITRTEFEAVWDVRDSR